MTDYQKWFLAVQERDDNRCQAEQHDPRCHGRMEHSHHICYKRHTPKETHWIVDNGVALSHVCHSLAHKTHNSNLRIEDILRAHWAINNAIQVFRDRTGKTYPFIPPHMDKSA